MANKYLNDTGLQYFFNKLKTLFLTNVAYDSTNKKLTKTLNGTTSDIVTISTIKSALSLKKSDVGLGNVDNTADANKNVRFATTASMLDTTWLLEGANFDGHNSVIHYATCPTAAATAAKVATITAPDDTFDTTFALLTGSRVIVKFTYANSAENATLNVNNTGAKPIYFNNAAVAKDKMYANGVYEFVYNGTQWELVGDLLKGRLSISHPRNTDTVTISFDGVNYEMMDHSTLETRLSTLSTTKLSGQISTWNDEVGHVTGWKITSGDNEYSTLDLQSQNDLVTRIFNSIDEKANIASPTFTGTPKAPTATAGTNTTQIATTAFVKTAVDNAVAGVTQFDIKVVTSLPTTGVKGTIYLVAHSHGTGDAYDEYIWTGSAYEKIGNTDIDLSGYLKKTDMVAITTSEIDTLFA